LDKKFKKQAFKFFIQPILKQQALPVAGEMCHIVSGNAHQHNDIPGSLKFLVSLFITDDKPNAESSLLEFC